MIIRRTHPSEVDEVMQIYANARAFMIESGNADQWGSTHPARSLIESDIATERGFVVEDNGEIVGAFFFNIGIDPTYLRIYDGNWINENEYGVIHRIAVKYHGRGIADFIYQHCFNQVKSLRIDTHEDNLPMQRSLQKNGFLKCGTIYLESGDKRIAYQKVK